MSDPGRSSVRAVGPLLAALAGRGMDADRIRDALGLAADALEEEGPGLTVEQMRRLWELGARTLEDPQVGHRLGRSVSRESFDVVSYVAASSSTLAEALTRIQRYLRLLTDALDYELTRNGEVAWLLLHPRRAEVAPIPHADEFSITARVAYVRQWLGREFRPREVFFRHGLPDAEDGSRTPADAGHASELRSFFGCPVHFGAHACGFSFDAAELDSELVGADPALGRLLSRYAEETLASLPPSDAQAARVRELLVAGMEAGEVRVADVAKKMATSERSLQRRLREEGTSFAALLEEVRRDLAIRYLRYGNLSASEVAYMLGYSEKATFFRAFRKWTGTTPGAFRAEGG